MAVIRVLGIAVEYGGYRAIDDVYLEVAPGEVVSVIGPNGSGKTTLLKAVDGILRPVKGSVYIDGRDLGSYIRREVAKIIGYVPQRVELLAHMTVLDFVLTGRRPYAEFSYSKYDVDKAIEALRLVGAELFLTRTLNKLSGGELQRIVIARALAAEPKVLLLDEPTSSLDPRYQVEILNLIRRLSKERGIAALMTIHDLTQAYRFSDKIVMLKNGKVVAAGKPEEVLTEENILKVFEVKARVIRELRAVIVEI